jgi:hypothetical protein
MHYGVLASPAATAAAGVFRVTIKNLYPEREKFESRAPLEYVNYYKWLFGAERRRAKGQQ